jgi:DNA-binding transcriptional ArsR family regulator
MKSPAAHLAAALADDTRLSILRLLADGTKPVELLCVDLEMTQPAVSYHLQYLLAAGMVDYAKRGKYRDYSLTPLGREALTALDRLTKSFEKDKVHPTARRPRKQP